MFDQFERTLYMGYRQLLYSHICYVVASNFHDDLRTFFTNKKIPIFFLELENVSRILSKKIGSFYAQEQVENKSFWWPTAFLQTVGHFGHLLTPAVKQLVWEGDEKMKKWENVCMPFLEIH